MMILKVTANAGQKFKTLIDLASDTNYITQGGCKSRWRRNDTFWRFKSRPSKAHWSPINWCVMVLIVLQRPNQSQGGTAFAPESVYCGGRCLMVWPREDSGRFSPWSPGRHDRYSSCIQDSFWMVHANCGLQVWGAHLQEASLHSSIHSSHNLSPQPWFPGMVEMW